MYALVIPKPPSDWGRQVLHEQPSMTGLKSVAYEACLRLNVPASVMALPKRYVDDMVSALILSRDVERKRDGKYFILTAVRVGQTQSNMSAPRATATTMSSG